MVLIPCPGCGRLVSDRGITCPDCASPITRSDPSVDSGVPPAPASSPTPRRPPRRFFEEAPISKSNRGCGHLFVHVPLLIVLMVGASVTVGNYVRAERSRERGYVAAMTADLESLVVVQEAYYATTASYGTVEDLGTSYLPSQGVTVRVVAADGRGWCAIASHARTDTFCTISSGTGPAALAGRTAEEPECRRER